MTATHHSAKIPCTITEMAHKTVVCHFFSSEYDKENIQFHLNSYRQLENLSHEFHLYYTLNPIHWSNFPAMNVAMPESDDQNRQTTRTGRFLGSMVNANILACRTRKSPRCNTRHLTTLILRWDSSSSRFYAWLSLLCRRN